MLNVFPSLRVTNTSWFPLAAQMLPRTHLAILMYLPSLLTRLSPWKQPPLLVAHGFSKASWKHWRMNRMRRVRWLNNCYAVHFSRSPSPEELGHAMQSSGLHSTRICINERLASPGKLVYIKQIQTLLVFLQSCPNRSISLFSSPILWFLFKWRLPSSEMIDHINSYFLTHF